MIDSNKLIGTAAQRIDNAHIKASVGLNAGDYGDQEFLVVIKMIREPMQIFVLKTIAYKMEVGSTSITIWTRLYGQVLVGPM